MKTEKKAIIKRIHILRGQLTGIEKLIEEECDCEKTLTQLKAVRSGLTSLTKLVFENQICKDLRKKSDQDQIKKILDTLTRY